MMRKPILTYTDIQGILPHRYPMLLIDAVYSMELDVSIVAIKNVTANEPCFANLPDSVDKRHLAYPVSLILESSGQAGGILWVCSMREKKCDVTGLPVFASAKNCTFEQDVYPGDVMEHHARLERVIGDTTFLSVETWVREERVARMEWLTAVSRPRELLTRQNRREL